MGQVPFAPGLLKCFPELLQVLTGNRDFFRISLDCYPMTAEVMMKLFNIV
jgi:hypothetical protein